MSGDGDGKLQTQDVRRGMQLLRKKWKAVASEVEPTGPGALIWMTDPLLDDGMSVIEFCMRFVRGPHSRRK